MYSSHVNNYLHISSHHIALTA